MNPLHYSIDTASCQFASVPYSTGYEAVRGSAFQSSPRAVLREEDQILGQRGRDKLESQNLDLQRNSSTASWVVRKHLDFVSTMNFDCQSDDKTLDEDIEGLIFEWSDKDEFDVRGRFGLHDHVRFDEASRTVRGDMLLQRLRSGHIQAIEGDRVRNPDPRRYKGDWKNGCLQNAAGRITHFAIHRRTDRGFEFERILPATEVYHFGYYIRHDQRRGISPMSCSINNLRQSHNAIRYAQAKQLISQIWGVKVKRESPQAGKIDLLGGPFIAELGIHEDAEVIADNTPSREFDAFLRHVIGMILKSVDLPYNFYDEAHTNFFGSRAALNLYLLACLAKRRGVQQLLNNLTLWRLNFEISRGRLRLPRSMDLKTIYRKHCEWIPVGMQWWNPLQEAKAAEIMLKNRLTSRAELRKQTTGDSWWSLMDRIEQEEIRIANNNFENDDDPVQLDKIVDQVVDGVVERLQAMGIAA